MSAHPDCGGDVAAYALGALDPGETRAFDRHLETCAVCRDELVAFRHVADVLPLSVPQHPAPRQLRRRVLDRRVLDPAARDARAHPAALGGARSRRPPRSGALRPRLALAGAAALALAVGGGVELGHDAQTTRQFRAQVTGVAGTARLLVSGSQAELVVHHLPQPAAGRIYELWLQRGVRPPQPTTQLFSPNAAGDGDVAVPGGVAGVSTVMVTEEPAGGSLVPTLPVLIRADV